MAAQSWAEWLSGLVSGLWPRLAPSPGTHEAQVEELRVSALLDKELRKPVGQRDEELVHKLRVERCKLGFKNAKVSAPPPPPPPAAESNGRLGQAPFCTLVPLFNQM